MRLRVKVQPTCTLYIATGHMLLFLILPVVMVQTIKHTHVGIAPAKRAYAFYRPTLPLGT